MHKFSFFNKKIVCNKYKKLTLAVYKENYNAVDFYKNKGFKIVSEGKNDDSGFDEYIMELIQ
jgi:putative acetyltransferase